MSSKSKGPEFLRFLNPILSVLRESGGSGTSTEVTDSVIDIMKIPEEKLEERLKSGASRIRNQIAWARIYLVKSGLLDDSSKRGVWSLTNAGWNANLSSGECLQLFKSVHSGFIQTKPSSKASSEAVDNLATLDKDSGESESPGSSHVEELISVLQGLSFSGFERLCQRILRESGFKQVVVTGKSGDGGIDGEGILEVNPLMSFKVMFQAKRYQGTVGSSTIRDFRGAIQGRADKGIIITTGRFTQDAKKEAVRDGASPIQLVDGESLVKLFENNGIGLLARTVFDVDYDFFEEYKN